MEQSVLLSFFPRYDDNVDAVTKPAEQRLSILDFAVRPGNATETERRFCYEPTERLTLFWATYQCR
jgi:hypothetical protein